MPADFLTPAEVAARLRQSKTDAVLKLIHSGLLPATNVSAGPGRPTWRIAAADLDAFLAGRRAVPAAKTRARRKRLEVTRYF